LPTSMVNVGYIMFVFPIVFAGRRLEVGGGEGIVWRFLGLVVIEPG
jgi:hypothetical protein